MDAKRIEEILDTIKGLRILVIGDLMWDRFIFGTAERLSPEAPVPVVKVERTVTTPGGAGNVVTNLAMLGAHVDVVGYVGSDPEGDEILNQLGRIETVDVSSVLRREGHTTTKVRVVADHQHIVRIDREEECVPEKRKIRAHLLKDKAERADVVVISDYRKGMVYTGLTRFLRNHWPALPIFVDPRPQCSNLRMYAGATGLKLNRAEAEFDFGRPLKDAQDAEQCVQEILDHTGVDVVVLTLGEDGMMLAGSLTTAGYKVIPFTSRALEVYDVTGAGDTAIAVFGACVAAGATYIEATNLANIAAGIVVGEVGTTTVTPTQILVRFRSLQPPTARRRR